MLASGLVEEVEKLLARGYSSSLKSMQALGYKHIAYYLNGLYDLGEAVRYMKRDTRNYAKRQLTWFRADGETQWFDGRDAGTIRNVLRNYLTSGGYEYS
jgi:tRNA dimethylallyltransferase